VVSRNRQSSLVEALLAEERPSTVIHRHGSIFEHGRLDAATASGHVIPE